MNTNKNDYNFLIKISFSAIEKIEFQWFNSPFDITVHVTKLKVKEINNKINLTKI